MRYGLSFPTLLILVLAGVAGCDDDVTDPDAFLESAEAEAVMESARQLPMLPDLLAEASPGNVRERAILLRAQELWAAGALTDGRADSRRRLAVGYALPVLVGSVPEEEWSAARDGMEEWMVTVERMLQQLRLPDVQERIVAARRYLARSEASAGEDRRRRYYLLLAMSELVETTPRFVAVKLVEEASRAVSRRGPPGEGATRATERALERAERLKDWAEQAVTEGEYLLAIQRAYYAVHLVEGS
ncbi:MAG: hypothetical protein R6U63_14670 [Longimicrobiales bacterium]